MSSVSSNSYSKLTKKSPRYRELATWGCKHLKDFYFNNPLEHTGNSREKTRHCTDYVCPANPLHPVDKALFVRRVGTRAPAVLHRFVPAGKQTKHLYPQDRQARVLRRLQEAYRLLPDPVGKIVYPKVETPGCPRPPSPIKVPTCCTFHRQEAQDLLLQRRQFLYHSPEPVLQPELTTNHSLDSRLKQSTSQKTGMQQPISTVVVRWNNYRSGFTYTDQKIYDIMNEYGPIKCICMGKNNNAYVVYDSLADACKPVFLKNVGHPTNKLFCHWFHRSMENKLFYGVNGRFKVKQDDV